MHASVNLNSKNTLRKKKAYPHVEGLLQIFLSSSLLSKCSLGCLATVGQVCIASHVLGSCVRVHSSKPCHTPWQIKTEWIPPVLDPFVLLSNLVLYLFIFLFLNGPSVKWNGLGKFFYEAYSMYISTVLSCII